MTYYTIIDDYTVEMKTVDERGAPRPFNETERSTWKQLQDAIRRMEQEELVLPATFLSLRDMRDSLGEIVPGDAPTLKEPYKVLRDALMFYADHQEEVDELNNQFLSKANLDVIHKDYLRATLPDDDSVDEVWDWLEDAANLMASRAASSVTLVNPLD